MKLQEKNKIKPLEKQFSGTGEVSGFDYSLFKRGEKALIYFTVLGNNTFYEVFSIKLSPMCLNFEKRIYSETDFKERYPKAKDFGIWAWTYRTKEAALKKLKNL